MCICWTIDFKSVPGSSLEYKEEEASVDFKISEDDYLPDDVDWDTQFLEAKPEEISFTNSQSNASPIATRIDNTGKNVIF